PLQEQKEMSRGLTRIGGIAACRTQVSRRQDFSVDSDFTRRIIEPGRLYFGCAFSESTWTQIFQNQRQNFIAIEVCIYFLQYKARAICGWAPREPPDRAASSPTAAQGVLERCREHRIIHGGFNDIDGHQLTPSKASNVVSTLSESK